MGKCVLMVEQPVRLGGGTSPPKTRASDRAERALTNPPGTILQNERTPSMELKVGDRVRMSVPLQPTYLGGPEATVVEVKEDGVYIDADPRFGRKPERVFIRREGNWYDRLDPFSTK
jgi:hypothetical protein